MTDIQNIYKCPIYMGQQLLKLSKNLESYLDPLFIYSLKCHGLPYPSIFKSLYLSNQVFLDYIYFNYEGMFYCYVRKPTIYYDSCILYPEVVDVIFDGLQQHQINLYLDILSDYLNEFGIYYYLVPKVRNVIHKLDKKINLFVATKMKKILYFFIDKSLYIRYITNIKKIIRRIA